jgi:putative ABC transport system permease protein
LWKRRFGADDRFAGKAVTLNSIPYTIVGVLPSGFQFPRDGIDVWLTRPEEFSAIPALAWPRTPYLIGFARLKPEVDLNQASAEISVLNHQYVSAHPELRDAEQGVTMRVTTLKEQLISDVRPTLLVLFGAVGLVLFIACANVASLLLARGASRSREFALRAALGAARSRLIKQLLAESLVLAIAGGALGVVLARWSLSAITHISERNLPRSGEIRLDGVVLLFTLGLSILTAILFSLLPSLQASRPNLAAVLQDRSECAGPVGHQSGWGGILRVRSSGLLVIGQIALSMVLLIGAALLLESLIRLQSVDSGFQPANLLTMEIALPRVRYDTSLKRTAFYQELVRRVETVQGVRGAAAALTLPMGPKWAVPIQVVEQPAVSVNDRPEVQLQSVTSSFFQTLGTPLLRGRNYTIRDDTPTSPPVVMINESFARRFWPSYPQGTSPIGQHLRLGNDQSSKGLEIIGIVADVHEQGLAIEAGPELYLPCHMRPPQAAGFIVRAVGDPRGLLSAVRSEVLAIDRDQPLSSVKTMDDLMETSMVQRRLTLFLLGLLAGLAMLLALVGIYGVIAYSVAQRTKELGIRRALGAQQADILWVVISQGIGLTLAGVAIGIAGALALTRAMRDLLFHVSATDPATFGCIAIMFVFVSLLASYIPARRATRIDPMVALRVG